MHGSWALAAFQLRLSPSHVGTVAA
jgi:hypothetical protein